MSLDESQRQKVVEWIGQGLKLSEIQSRLASELGARLTYMDVRFLVDDLKLTPKDIERPKVAASALTGNSIDATASKAGAKGSKPGLAETKAAEPAKGAGKVSVSVDQLTRPGAVVSGKVIFSDGKQADWYLDQTGRLGLSPQQAGYRPAAADVQEFQAALEGELSRMGL